MNINNFLRYKRQAQSKTAIEIKIHEESLKKIKGHYSTHIIQRSEFPAAFDYIDKRFPDADTDAVIYQSSRAYLDKIGYSGIGGFYSRLQKIIIIPNRVDSKIDPKNKSIWTSIKIDMTIDEILVHEMCHYVSGKTFNTLRTLQVEEEFAYGNSVDYSRSKGRTDDDIIRKNFMPYLLMIMRMKNNYQPDPTRSKKDEKIIFDKCYDGAYKLGQSIIAIWDEKNNPNKADVDTNTSLFKKPEIDIDLD